MNRRRLGSVGRVSEVGYGSWEIGGDWGEVTEDEAIAAVETARDVGVICRVPFASGLLAGALSRDAEFPEDDHRSYNREGDAFDVGETFAGVPFEAGLGAVDAVDERRPDDRPLPEFSLRWVLDHDAVSTVIPGSTTPAHIESNTAASEAPSPSNAERGAASAVYGRARSRARPPPVVTDRGRPRTATIYASTDA